MKQIIYIVLFFFCVGFLSAQVYVEVGEQHSLDRGYGIGIFGGGISFCDFNGDGWDDLTFATQGGDSLLFLVNNEGSLVKIPALITDTGHVEQVLWADYDNDGDKDLFVTCIESYNKLYNNDGNLNLTEVTEVAGLSMVPRNSYGAAFGDYNNDGWLDLYVCNRYADDSADNELYLNDGTGHFSSTGVSAGAEDEDRPSFCAAFLDYNLDGLQDIYVSNDRYFARNSLLKNKGDGTFEDVSVASGTDISIDAMNVGVGDYNNDGFQDIYVTNTPNGGNMLLKNKGDGTFEEVAEQCGVDFHKVGWGGNFLDFDNDTDLDLYVSAMNTGADAPNSLYDNDGADSFTEPWILEGDTVKSFSNAVGDFNNDGRLDIAVSNTDSFPFMLWENQVANGNHWLKVKLRGTLSNRDGVGTWLEFYIDGQKIVRYSHCGEAYLAQNSSTIHVGLGDSEVVDSIRVRWLSGVEDRLFDVPADQVIEVVEESTVSTHLPGDQPRFSVYPNPVNELLFVQYVENRPVEADFEIIAIDGKLLKAGRYDSRSGINISGFAPGKYLLKMNGQSRRFIISR